MRNAALKADFKHVVLLRSESKLSLRGFVFVEQDMALGVSHLLLQTHTETATSNVQTIFDNKNRNKLLKVCSKYKYCMIHTSAVLLPRLLKVLQPSNWYYRHVH